jgi:hypothetical protein
MPVLHRLVPLKSTVSPCIVTLRLIFVTSNATCWGDRGCTWVCARECYFRRHSWDSGTVSVAVSLLVFLLHENNGKQGETSFEDFCLLQLKS